MDTIFTGIRVLSLAEQYPGPYATLLLADLGADVVQIERPNGGDPARAYPAIYKALARNKRSACIDLKSEDGKAQLRALVRSADVLIEGYRPGTMDRLGVGYSALRQVNPRLIFASISGFGQTGPYRDRTAHDLSYQTVAGHMFDRIDEASPVLPQIAYGDLSSGLFAAFGIASALFARERTGVGTSIDVSMTDGLVSFMTAYLAPTMAGAPSDFVIFGEPAYGVFAVAGGRKLSLSIAHEDNFWRSLCGLLGMDDVSSLLQPARIAQADILRSRIADGLLPFSMEHWAPLLDANSIPWSPVSGLEHVVADPHFNARDLFVDVAGRAGVERHVRQPVKFGAWASGIVRTAPDLGEHTDEVLAPSE